MTGRHAGGEPPPRNEGDPPTAFQLPPPPRNFVGRETDLAALRALVADQEGPYIIVLSGTAGIGKTALAVRWLPELRTDYTDFLFTDLNRGSTEPVAAAEALEWFLLSLGVPAERVPVAASQRETMYRTVTSQRRLVVLLDDAVSATQVRPLLPASRASVVVVTSRFRLSGLAMDGALWVDLGPLDSAASLEMLRQRLGKQRVQAELAAARELVDLCGGLPLALSVVAARLVTRPHRRLAQEVENLAVEQHRLAGLSLTDDVSVRAVFDVSCADLTQDTERLYRLCAAHPGPDFGADVAAAGLEWAGVRTETALERLLEANLLIEDVNGYRYHDLLRVHALERSGQEDPPETRDGVLRRMIEWYVDEVVAADQVIHPLRPRLGPRYAMPRRRDIRFADPPAALSWLESRRAHVRSALTAAVQHQWYELGWQLCEALWGFFLHTRHYGDWIAMHQLGIKATGLCGDRRAEARLRSQLGFAYAKLHRYDESVAENTTALQLAEAEHDTQATATALSQLGRVTRETGELPAALEYFRRARDAQDEIGQRRGVALSRRRIGQILARLDRHAEAADEFAAAAREMRELADNTQYARTLMFLGESRARAGQLDSAEAPLREALALMREFGSPYYQAEVLARLGDVQSRQGDLAAAKASLRAAVDLYAAVEDPQADLVRARLAQLGE